MSNQAVPVGKASSKTADRAVKHVSVDINRSETIALVGESGSGKSVTTLSVLQLLRYHTESVASDEIFEQPETDYAGELISAAFDLTVR